MKKIKFYVEVTAKRDYQTDIPYILQSEWFNTEQKAIQWAKKISYLSNEYDVYLMIAEWENEEYYTDIQLLRNIKNELLL